MRAEAEAALDSDRVTEIHGGDYEATDGARWRLQEAPEPPTILATCETRGSQVKEAITGRT